MNKIIGNNKNIDILTSFLKSVLDLPESEYSKITIVDPHSRIENIEDKTVMLDVKLHIKSGKIIDIEIQVSGVPQMKERIIYYTSKMITEQIGKGEQYNLKKVISIVITDYKLITENEQYHNTYHLYDKNTDSKFSDVLEINTLELPKVPKETDNTELWNWLKFLKADREEELSMIKEKSPEIEKAVGVLKELSQDERTKLLYEAREKARRDEQARIMEAYVEGIAKVAINLYRNGMTVNDIMKFTGLTKEETEKLIIKIEE